MDETSSHYCSRNTIMRTGQHQTCNSGTVLQKQHSTGELTISYHRHNNTACCPGGSIFTEEHSTALLAARYDITQLNCSLHIWKTLPSFSVVFYTVCLIGRTLSPGLGMQRIGARTVYWHSQFLRRTRHTEFEATMHTHCDQYIHTLHDED
jgi:hypothetical protein